MRLKAWDLYFDNIDGKEARSFYTRYIRQVDRIAEEYQKPKELIDRLVQYRYAAWKKANSRKFPTVPPKA